MVAVLTVRATYPVGRVAAVAPVRPIIPPPVIAFVRLAPVRVAPVSVAPVRVAPVRMAPDKSIPVIFTSVKLIEESAAPNALTPAPMIYPLRATYPVGKVAVARPVIPPDDTRVNTVDAPLIFALVIFVPASETPDKSTLVSAALVSDTFGPTMNPLRNTYPVGRVARPVAGGDALFTSPPVTRRTRVAPVRLAPEIFAPVKMTSVRSREPVPRFALMSETPAPRIYPPRTTYPVGITSAVDAPPVTPPLVTPVNITRERLAAEISTFTKLEFVKTQPDKSAPVRGTPVKLISVRPVVTPRRRTYGPRIYPLRATYPLGSDAVSAPVIAPETRRVNVAPMKFALVMFVPTRDCPLMS